MNDASHFIPSPDALPLPAPEPLLRGLLLLTFLLHLIAMNGLLGGVLLALWSRLRSRAPEDLHAALAGRIGRLLPTFVAGTVTFGVAPLLFLQALYGRWFFTSSVLLGWPWLAIVPLVTLAYYGVYLESLRRERLGRLRTPLLAAVALLLLAVALIYTSNVTLMLQPPAWAAAYFAQPGGGNFNFGDPQVVPRWLHMVLGAVAVAGLLTAWGGEALRRRDAAAAAFMRTHGLTALGAVTMANFLVGMWFLMALPRPVMLGFMGGSGHATGLLGAGLVLALALIALAMRARGRPDASLRPVTAVTLLTLIVMVLMRDHVRAASLAATTGPAATVRTQGLNLALFGLLLVGAGLTVWWLARRLARGAGA